MSVSHLWLLSLVLLAPAGAAQSLDPAPRSPTATRQATALKPPPPASTPAPVGAPIPSGAGQRAQPAPIPQQGPAQPTPSPLGNTAPSARQPVPGTRAPAKVYDRSGRLVPGAVQVAPNRVLDTRTGRYYNTLPTGDGQRLEE